MKKKNQILSLLLFFSFSSFAQLHIEGVFFVGEDAEVHVWNDLDIATTNGELSNEGTIEVEGNFSIDSEANFISNPNGIGQRLVVFQNNDFNNANSQRITGELTGSNAFYNIEIGNQSPEALVDLDGNMEVTNQLIFINGRLRSDIMSRTDGLAYAGEVFVSNPINNSIGNEAALGGESRYVEGRLRRAIDENNQTLNFPIGLADGAEPFEIQFSNPIVENTIIAAHQLNSTTDEGAIQPCDVGTGGPNPDPLTPDGVLDDILIDCVTGQWVVEADVNVSSTFDLNIFPSENLLANCSDGIYFFVGENGALEDCPDVDATDGVSRTGLSNLGNFDIATGSQANTDFSSIEVIPSNDSRITIFPNPVSEQIVNLKIEGSVFEGGAGNLSVHDVLGRIVFQTQIEFSGREQTFSIQMPEIANGIHQLVLRNNTQLTTKSCVVMK